LFAGNSDSIAQTVAYWMADLSFHTQPGWDVGGIDEEKGRSQGLAQVG
tara:strand:+ start:756 stop:899 length:144 start_codon:yes stop_codon:yes gene_type:complete